MDSLSIRRRRPAPSAGTDLERHTEPAPRRARSRLLPPGLAVVVCALASFVQVTAKGADMPAKPTLFDTKDPGCLDAASPRLQPWKRVPLDPAYSGAWTLTGDVDGDGQAEIVTARNVNTVDVHYTSTVVAQRLDGTVLWHWGDPAVGRRGLHHDVACQLHDWDGDGKLEVILCADGFLVELDGATGRERRRLAIPPEATDCLVFADLSGRGRATDVLVKTRYSQIWALNEAGRELWTIKTPAGYPTAHQPIPVDVDGDGRQEIMAGYALLNADGSVRWALPDGGRFKGGGHLDCGRVLRRGAKAADTVLLLTCCGHNRLLAVDGNGSILWEIGGHHFESIDIGRICADRPGLQLLVDVVPTAAVGDQNELWIVGEDGEHLGRIAAEYTRFHALADLNGDGLDEIILPHSRGVFDGHGRRVGTFAMEPQADLYGGKPHAEGEIGNIVVRGDMNGDGIPDVTLTTPLAAYIFTGAPGAKAAAPAALGCGPNFTLY